MSEAISVRTVRGTSMRPLLRTGCRVGIGPVPPGGLQPGDIAAFASRGRVILHRIIARRIDAGRIVLREKGDNRPFATTISEDQCIGKALWADERGSRRVLDVPPGRRLRLLTGLFLLEAAFFELMRRGWTAAFGSTRSKSAVKLMRAIRVLLLPVRVALSPLVFSVHPTDRGEGEDAVLRILVRVMRRLTRPAEPGEDCLDDAPWRDVFEVATLHGVEGLVGDLLSGPSAGGEDVAREIKMQRYRAALQQAAAAATMREASDALQARGIPIAVLKGPPLAAELYNDPSLRPSSDVDILVRKEDLDRAVNVLTASTHRLYGSAASQRLARRAHFHVVLDPVGKNRTKIEVHWDLVDRANLYRIDTAGVLRRLRGVAVDGKQVPVPCLEDALIYLCLHAAKHGLFNAAGLKAGAPATWYLRQASGNRLVWFVDLHLLLKKHLEHIDWSLVRSRISEWNVVEEMTETLRVLELVLADAQATRALELLGWVRPAEPHVAVAAPPGGGVLRGRFMDARNDLVIRPARLLTMRSFLFPSPDRIMRYYGATRRRQLPGLYLRHPFHMARRLLAA